MQKEDSKQFFKSIQRMKEEMKRLDQVADNLIEQVVNDTLRRQSRLTLLGRVQELKEKRASQRMDKALDKDLLLLVREAFRSTPQSDSTEAHTFVRTVLANVMIQGLMSSSEIHSMLDGLVLGETFASKSFPLSV